VFVIDAAAYAAAGGNSVLHAASADADAAFKDSPSMTVTLDTVREFCLQKKGTMVTFPFGETTLVMKVMGKIFLLADIESDPLRISLKCEPDLASTLRHQYPAVQPGYHLNKEHWNTITIDGTIPDEEIFVLIDHAYERVVSGLKKADRAKLAAL
jgi:predicted DNA-binding protein (MmcQ/YjbR family)